MYKNDCKTHNNKDNETDNPLHFIQYRYEYKLYTNKI